MQTIDLQHQQKEAEKEGTHNSSLVITGGGSLDWIDAWSPQEQEIETTTTMETQNNIRTKVRNHLGLLQQELRHIQRKHASSLITTNKALDEAKRIQQTRVFVANRHISEQQPRHNWNRHFNKKCPNGNSKQTPTEDTFCVQDYESDNDNKANTNNLLESFLLLDTDNIDDLSPPEKLPKLQAKENITPDAITLLDGKLLDGSSYLFGNALGNVRPGSGVRKIIYAARTHSQLSQFVSEIRRATHPSSSSAPKVVSLGGRSLLCGNEAVVRNSKSNEAWITEQCLDLQKQGATKAASGIVHINDKSMKKQSTAKRSTSSSTSSSSKTSGCPLLQNTMSVATLGMHFLAIPSDIEDEAILGKATQKCAYYATRLSLPAADVIAVPYTTLLSAQNRQAIGLSLKEACVIIDEAHNIPETLRDLKGCTLDLPTILQSSSQLHSYMERYSHRIAGRNLFYLSQIVKCLKAMTEYLSNASNPSNSNCCPSTSQQQHQNFRLMTIFEFLFALKLDNVNLYKLSRYLKVSKLSQKLLGFISSANPYPEDATSSPEGDKDFMSKHVSAMSFVERFLSSLNNEPASIGKVIIEFPTEDGASTNSLSSLPPSKHPGFRYVLLNPTTDFNEIANEAYAVVLAGGTLSPFTHLCSELLCNNDSISTNDEDISLLRDASQADEAIAKSSFQSTAAEPFAKWQSNSFVAFSCGHVVPPSNVFLRCLSEGPTCTKLDFRHSSRASAIICDELGLAILELIRKVPAGVIVFLPSYSYEEQLVRRWRQSGLFDKLKQEKRVHREPRKARDTKQALEAYNKDAKGSGALLLSIIGGKMSEGINFADDLARCVIVVGLPYPDISDPILIEKMKSLDNAQQQKTNNKGNEGALLLTGRSYYQNLCMRAVNQSIGRAFRHSNDYAAVILADFRYASDPKVWNKLPQWLRSSGCGDRGMGKSFSSIIAETSHFFVEKRGCSFQK